MTTDPQHVYVVTEINDSVVRRVHGYFASLHGAFGYCETEERKKPLVDSARFELFAAPGGEKWLIHCFYGPEDRHPVTSDFVIRQAAVIPDPVSSAVAQSAPAETALRDRIATLTEDLRYVLDYRGPRHAHERPGVWDTSGKPCEHCARLAVVRKNLDSYDADPDAVLAVLPTADRPAEEAYRLAVSAALGLGTGANWEAIRDRAEDLTAEVRQLTEGSRRLLEQRQPASVDRATVLNEAAVAAASGDVEFNTEAISAAAANAGPFALVAYVQLAVSEHLRRMAVEAQQQTETLACVCGAPAIRDGDRPTHQPGTGDTCMYLPDARPRCPDCQMPHVITPGMQLACASILASIRDRDAVVPGGAGEEPADEALTLAAMFEGLHTLLATSSRDWSTYRVDAWLWAVLCGWDCEQTEHDETCTHGAMEEMQQQHGWDDEAVAKARRYRAVVRAIENRGAVTGGAEAHPPTRTWKVESPRRDKWASWGATHDERVWAAASYDDVIEIAPQRPFRLVRATTTYAVETEHQPATEPAVGAQQPKEAEGPRTVCVCGHTRAEHVTVGGPFGCGRLLCTVCNGLDGNACKEFEAL